MKQSVYRASRGIITSLVAILMGFIFGAVLMAASGNNPFEGFLYLFQGSLKNLTRASNTLAYAIPLILTGLSIAFSFKTGLFNIGAPGQMLMGGLAAMVAGQTLTLPRPLFLVVMILAAMAGGLLWSSISGVLKVKFNVNEVVSGIMLNWIAYWTVYFVISEHFKSGSIETESRAVPAAASLKAEWLTQATGGSNLNLGIFIAIIAILLVAFILNKTTLGYQMKAVGYNHFAAEYGGISVPRNTILALGTSGMLAGLAGLCYYCGYLSNIRIGIMPSQGFDGIAVALLANNSAVGVLFSAFFFAALQTGKGYMNAMLPIAPEIADTIIAVIIYFSATSLLISKQMDNIRAFFTRRTQRKAKEA